MLRGVTEQRFVSTRIAAGLVRALEALGTPAEELDRVLGVPRERAADPDARLPVGVLYDLWELGARHRKHPALPIEVTSTKRSPPHADVFSFVCQTSPTLRAAMMSSTRFLALRATSFHLELRDEPGEYGEYDACALIQHRPPAARLGRRFAIEATLAEILGALRGILDATLAPLRVEFEHPAPRDVSAHAAYFRSPVRFGSARNALVFRRDDVDRPLPMGDPAMAAYFHARCTDALASCGCDGDLVEGVRDVLLRTLPAVPSVAHVAHGLALSERTLRRRLTERGTSFDTLLRGARIALAEQHLARSDLAISDIGYLTGFSDVSAFGRFFRRQTGRTPAQHRKRSP